MIVLGKRQILYVVKKVDFGVYLAEKSAVGLEEPEEKVLLPKKQVPENILMGDELEVFIYRDSMDRLIATVQEVLIEREQTAVLNVADTSRIGAFLDWGLEKDLLLPFKEWIYEVKQDDEVLVTLYLDKSERLCASMKVYELLRCDSPYNKDDEVDGRVYETSDNFGIFIAVDDKYSALLPKKEVFETYHINQQVHARVTQVLEDGRLTLSVKKKIPEQMNEDAEYIFNCLKDAGGFLPFNDKSDPKDIKNQFHMSKNAYKRAIGHLLKDRLITIENDGIHMV